jgi:hypothetical protein
MPVDAGRFDYGVWSGLLAEVVTPDGKVDYDRLAARRARLDDFVAALGAASPESAPDRFPSDDERLAYWINAYNAFTLHAILAEYPISSVWRARDGQFFQRRRHVAGGRAVSLDDIEHEILRGRFAEPRIHFAINCGSNGCPPMRPPRTRAPASATRSAPHAPVPRQRVELPPRFGRAARPCVAHLQDVRGGLRRPCNSTAEYRRGVLRFVAEHTGEPFERIADWDVVYNVYDWGLNDASRAPHLGPILFHEPVEHFHDGDTELRELHLYEGNFCNRTCTWCTIDGSPKGWYRPYAPAVSTRRSRRSRPTATSSSTAASRRSTPTRSRRPCATCARAASAG